MERLKVITCILPSGGALELLERLRTEFGVTSAFAHHAREVTFRSVEEKHDIADESEIVTVLADETRAETLFDLLTGSEVLGAHETGMVFMERTLAGRASPAPEIADEPAP